MSYELIALLMFSTMMLLLFSGQRVFGAIDFVAVIGELALRLGGDDARIERLRSLADD